ncbi:MAG: lysophospholipid acyltransferase family protein [Desulfuromonadaceae bacterium]|nr:lysophospholipid acyltransferase family protein [Desulfuromonadaceae bacterium]
MIKNVIWLFQVAVLYVLTLAFAVLPACLVYPTGRFVGRLGGVIIPKRRRIAVDNISKALPTMMKRPGWNCPLLTPEEIARVMFCHLGMSFVEVCRLYHGRSKDVMQRVEVRGTEYLEAARARGKGVVILTGHCGNWELAALALARHFDTPMSVVARRQDNPYLNKIVEKVRLRYGNLIIYKNSAIRNMLSVIRKNGVIGLLIDQAVFPENGALVNFLGRTAWASKVPVLLARKSGTAVVPAFIHREEDRHIIDIYPELVFSSDASDQGVAADVATYSQAIENFIVQHPVDWYWVHRRWKRAGELVAD